MLKKATSFVRKSIRKFPFLRPLDNRISFYLSFRVEKALLRGRHKNHNLHPSILYFTTNKAASQHVMSLLTECATYVGMTSVNLNSYIFHTALPFLDQMSPQEFKEHAHVFKPKGYLYGTFGGMIDEIPDFNRYKVVLMLRDPRDVLVSHYYSKAYSHPLPREGSARRSGFVQSRKAALETSLDDYVRETSGWVKGVYKRYYDVLIRRDPPIRYYYTTYEEMVADYPAWLKGLLEYTELDIPPSMVQALINENERSRPVAEDVYKQRRLGRSGDYLEKLSPDTVAWLNTDLAEILDIYGYSSSGLPKLRTLL